MEKPYEIIKCHDKKYSCIVIPTFRSNPLDQLDLLTSQLKEKQISGIILFDFILSSGNTEERYASILFDGGFFKITFKCISINKDDPIRKCSSDFLRAKIGYTDVSMLSNSQISLLKAGYDI